MNSNVCKRILPVVLVSPIENRSFIHAAGKKTEANSFKLRKRCNPNAVIKICTHSKSTAAKHQIIKSSKEVQQVVLNLNKYYLTSICPGVRAECLHTAGNAGETPPRSWRTDLSPSAPGRPFPRGAVGTDVQSRAATSGHSQCSTLSDLQAGRDVKAVRKHPAAAAINDLIWDHFFSDINVTRSRDKSSFFHRYSVCILFDFYT